MRHNIAIAFYLCLLTSSNIFLNPHQAQAAENDSLKLQSPDGQIAVDVKIQQLDGVEGRPVYSVSYRGKQLIAPSPLGFELQDDRPLTSGFTMLSAKPGNHDSTWQPVYGERSQVRDHYNELNVKLSHTATPGLQMELKFRCYDAGVGFCYQISSDQPGSITIGQEKSEFRWLADHTAWCVTTAQGKYNQCTLSTMGSQIERPLTIKVDDETYVAIAEANLVDYARMKLGQSAGQPLAVVSQLSSGVQAELPLTTPWRVIMIADSPAKLLENNDIILNLSEPNALADSSWIRPGKVIREVTLTTLGGKACVDFAVQHNLQYVEFDAGWYGNEYSDESDATTVTLDPKRSRGPLDLQEVVRYAAQHDIGIILYVNRRALERQLDALLPLYERWGIKGVKYGFVNVGSQTWTSWLHAAIRKAAEHRLMVDVHDEYRPTGYSRTYPNLMTQEGIGGDETSPTNEQTLTILFTRMLAGAGDNTICYYDSRVDRHATHAYQLAKAVCFYSPWQFLYWYDRPEASPAKAGGAGGQHNTIGDEPELEFYDHIPTVWDDTRVLDGSIGQYAVIARRSGADWFVGCMHSGPPRSLRLPLDFLPPDRQFMAHIYSDDSTIPTRTQVRIQRRTVTSRDVLDVALVENGGQAIRLVPME